MSFYWIKSLATLCSYLTVVNVLKDAMMGGEAGRTSSKRSGRREETRASKRSVRLFRMPPTVSHPALRQSGSDATFRRTLYLMVLTFGRLQTCREAFGRAMGLTGSQFAVMVGTAYCQNLHGVSIRALAEHVQLAPTHVTTEVGRLVRRGLLTKRANRHDRRGVLVRLTRRGEDALIAVAPLVRRVNDLLFRNVSRAEFAALSRFLATFAANSEEAVAEIRRIERARHAPGD
jgi:DNA-binding MarR family transcriptional regulator